MRKPALLTKLSHRSGPFKERWWLKTHHSPWPFTLSLLSSWYLRRAQEGVPFLSPNSCMLYLPTANGMTHILQSGHCWWRLTAPQRTLCPNLPAVGFTTPPSWPGSCYPFPLATLCWTSPVKPFCPFEGNKTLYFPRFWPTHIYSELVFLSKRPVDFWLQALRKAQKRLKKGGSFDGHTH